MPEPRGLWERTAPWIAAAAVVLALVFAAVIVYQQHDIRQAQQQLQTFTENAHSNTVAILNEHTTTLKEIASLRTEVTNLSEKDGPVLVAGQNALIAKLDWIECDTATPGQCGPRP